MPTSNLTRVRVDGFSNTMASFLPASGRGSDAEPSLKPRPRSSMPRKVAPSKVARSRKCRGSAIGLLPIRGEPVENGDRLVDMRFVDGQRRQQPNCILVGAEGDRKSTRLTASH